MRSRRFVLLSAFVAVVGCSFAFAACSSNDTSNDAGTGGGPDATTGDDGSSGDDATTGDDARAGDDTGVRGDTGGGHCSPVQGSCDIVLQDCPTGKECTVVQGAGGSGLTTACVTAGTGNKPSGARCCPNEANQCVAGLECIGPDCTADASVPTGRCTPHCCAGDDTPCGTSVPEGFHGTCDLGIVEDPGDGGSVPVFDVCSYKGVCKPFHLQDCPPNYTCLLQDDGVSFRCTAIFQPPGKSRGDTCSLANDCADGLLCLGAADAATSNCTQTCYRSDGGAPFDAAALQDAAGYGGCPGSGGCNGSITGAPPWLGFCP